MITLDYICSPSIKVKLLQFTIQFQKITQHEKSSITVDGYIGNKSTKINKNQKSTITGGDIIGNK
jgi:hypothetical protein